MSKSCRFRQLTKASTRSVQGRADVSNHAIGAAKVKEADAAVGVRYLSLDCSPQGDARVRKAVPGYSIVTLKSGSSTGIIGDTCVLSYDHLHGSATKDCPTKSSLTR